MWDTSWSASTTLDWGNLDQVRVVLRGHVAHDGASWSNSVEASGALVWLRPGPGLPFTAIGREVIVSDRVAWRPVGRFEVSGLARYESNLLRKLNHRGLVGGGVGAYAIDDGPTRLSGTLAVVGELSRWASTDFIFELDDPGATRAVGWVAAVVVASTAWDERRSTARGSALVVVNPVEPREHRTVLDGVLNVRILGPVGAQLSATWIYDPFVLVGVDRHDVRINAGLSVAFDNRS